MDNQVGDNLPNKATLDKLLKQLSDVVTELHKFGVVLSVDDRKRLLRARKDSEPMMQRVYELAKKYNLTMPDFSYESLKNDLTLIEVIRPFEDLLTQGAQLAQDTAGQAEHEAWQAFLLYYGMLSSMAERNATIASELSTIREFMSVKPRAVVKKTPKP